MLVRTPKRLEYRELTGPEETKIFENIKISALLNDETMGNKIQNLWAGFVDIIGDLRGCPPKNRPLNSDQNFNFLQNFSTKQGLYKVKENTFRCFLYLIIVEILRM